MAAEAGGEGEAQPGAFFWGGEIEAGERLEQPRLIGGRDARTGVAHGQFEQAAVGGVGGVDGEGDRDMAGVGELDGVAGEIEQNLAEALAVDHQPRGEIRGDRAGEGEAFGGGKRAQAFDRVVQDGGHGGRFFDETKPACVQRVEVDQIVHEAQHGMANLAEGRDAGAAAGGDDLVFQKLGVTEQALQRGAQLVADFGEKFGLEAVGLGGDGGGAERGLVRATLAALEEGPGDQRQPEGRDQQRGGAETAQAAHVGFGLGEFEPGEQPAVGSDEGTAAVKRAVKIRHGGGFDVRGAGLRVSAIRRGGGAEQLHGARGAGRPIGGGGDQPAVAQDHEAGHGEIGRRADDAGEFAHERIGRSVGEAGDEGGGRPGGGRSGRRRGQVEFRRGERSQQGGFNRLGGRGGAAQPVLQQFLALVRGAAQAEGQSDDAPDRGRQQVGPGLVRPPERLGRATGVRAPPEEDEEGQKGGTDLPEGGQQTQGGRGARTVEAFGGGGERAIS